MTLRLTRFGAADFLRDEDDIVAYFAECAKDGDPALIARQSGARRATPRLLLDARVFRPKPDTAPNGTN